MFIRHDQVNKILAGNDHPTFSQLNFHLFLTHYSLIHSINTYRALLMYQERSQELRMVPLCFFVHCILLI